MPLPTAQQPRIRQALSRIVPTRQSGVAFDGAAVLPPSSFPGLQLWLRSDTGLYQDAAGTTPAVADADPVGLWQDQSGKGNHVSQGTGSKKPTLKVAQKNGYSSIRTDGVNDYLKSSAFTLNQPVFGILALKLIAAADGSRYWDGNAADSAECYQAASGGLGGVRIYAGSAAIGPVSFTSGTFRLIETLHNAASSQIWVNTVSGVTGSIGTNNPGGITLGARGDGVSGFSNLDILEFCLFSTTPSAANQALLEYYFNSRYSLY